MSCGKCKDRQTFKVTAAELHYAALDSMVFNVVIYLGSFSDRESFIKSLTFVTCRGHMHMQGTKFHSSAPNYE